MNYSIDSFLNQFLMLFKNDCESSADGLLYEMAEIVLIIGNGNCDKMKEVRMNTETVQCRKIL